MLSVTLPQLPGALAVICVDIKGHCHQQKCVGFSERLGQPIYVTWKENGLLWPAPTGSQFQHGLTQIVHNQRNNLIFVF